MRHDVRQEGKETWCPSGEGIEKFLHRKRSLTTLFFAFLLLTLTSSAYAVNMTPNIAVHFSLNESSGSSIVDDANLYNATFIGTENIKAGILGNARNFTGAAGDFIAVSGGTAPGNFGTGSWTIGWWSKLTVSSFQFIGGNLPDSPAAGNGWYVYTSTKMHVSAGQGADAFDVASNTSVNTDAWQNWVFTINQTNHIWKMYLNGVLDAYGDYGHMTNANSTNATGWGAQRRGVAGTSGLLDEIVMLKDTVGQDWVTAYYNGGAGLPWSNWTSGEGGGGNASNISIALASPADGATQTTNPATLAYNLSGTNATATCQLNINGTFNKSATGLSNGAQSFSVNFTNGTYNWNVNCSDGWTSNSTTNRSINVSLISGLAGAATYFGSSMLTQPGGANMPIWVQTILQATAGYASYTSDNQGVAGTCVQGTTSWCASQGNPTLGIYKTAVTANTSVAYVIPTNPNDQSFGELNLTLYAGAYNTITSDILANTTAKLILTSGAFTEEYAAQGFSVFNMSRMMAVTRNIAINKSLIYCEEQYGTWGLLYPTYKDGWAHWVSAGANKDAAVIADCIANKTTFSPAKFDIYQNCYETETYGNVTITAPTLPCTNVTSSWVVIGNYTKAAHTFNVPQANVSFTLTITGEYNASTNYQAKLNGTVYSNLTSSGDGILAFTLPAMLNTNVSITAGGPGSGVYDNSTTGNYTEEAPSSYALLNPGAASGTGLNWSALYHNMTAAKFLSGNVTRIVGGDLYVPWMDSSTACGVANLKTYGTHTASNFTDGYLQVSDEHSVLLYNLGTGKNDDAMWNIAQSLVHMTVGRGQLPGWICVINESTSNVNCSVTGVNSNNDTASDATARYILGLYAAYVNTNYTNATRKAYYLSLANNLTRDMLTYEMVTPDNSNSTSCHNNTLGWGGNICYWIKGGSAANLTGTDGVYTGYFGEVIDALLNCYLRSSNTTCLAAARNVTLNYLQASYPSAMPMTSFRVPPGKAFKWVFTANDSQPDCTNTCDPDYWDSVDAPRATSICRASYHSDQYNVTLAPMLDDYCLNWSNAKAGNLTSWMYQYYSNGSNAANAVSGFWSQGLEAQLLLGIHNATAVNTSLTSCASHYAPATGKWDSTSCTGVYEQQMCMNSISVAIGLDYYPPEGNTNTSNGSDTSVGTWRTRVINFTGDNNASVTTASVGTTLTFGQGTTYYTTNNPLRPGFSDGLRNTLETAEKWCDEMYGTNATLYSKTNAYGYEYVWQYSGGTWTQTGASHVYGITSITCSVPTTNTSKNTYITNDLAIFGGVASGILLLQMSDGAATDVNMSYSCGEAAWTPIANNTQFTCNNIDVRVKAVLTNATTNTPTISNLTLNYTTYKNAYFKFLYNNTDTELWPICYEASTGNYLPVSDGDYYSLSSSVNETLLCEPTDSSAAHQSFNVSVTADDGFYNETINVATYALTLTFDKATNGSIYWTDYDENLTEDFDIPTLQYVKLKASLPADLVSIRFNLQGNYSRQYYMFQNNPGTATTDTVHVLDSLNTYVRFDVRDYGNGIISGATIRITQPNTTNSPVVQQIITDSISGGYDGGPVYLDFSAINTITVTKDGYATWQRTLDAAGFEDYANTGKPITIKLKPISAVTGSAWLLACDAEYTTQTTISCLVSSRGAIRVHYATDYRPTESIQNFQNGGAAITLTQGRDYLAATNFTVTLTDDDGTVVASQAIHYNPEAHKSIMAGLLASYSDTTKTAITAFLWAMLVLFAGFIGSTLITQSGADTGYYWFGGGTVLFAVLIPTFIPVAAIFVVTMIGDAIKNAYQD